MRITIEIDESSLSEILKATGEKKKSPAIRQALEEYVAERRRRDFLRKVLQGQSDYGRSNQELEALGTYDAG